MYCYFLKKKTKNKQKTKNKNERKKKIWSLRECLKWNLSTRTFSSNLSMQLRNVYLKSYPALISTNTSLINELPTKLRYHAKKRQTSKNKREPS